MKSLFTGVNSSLFPSESGHSQSHQKFTKPSGIPQLSKDSRMNSINRVSRKAEYD